jgi:hypothetical protein
VTYSNLSTHPWIKRRVIRLLLEQTSRAGILAEISALIRDTHDRHDYLGREAGGTGEARLAPERIVLSECGTQSGCLGHDTMLAPPDVARAEMRERPRSRVDHFEGQLYCPRPMHRHYFAFGG